MVGRTVNAESNEEKNEKNAVKRGGTEAVLWKGQYFPSCCWTLMLFAFISYLSLLIVCIHRNHGQWYNVEIARKKYE